MNDQPLIFAYSEENKDVFTSTEYLTPIKTVYTDGVDVFRVDTMPLKPNVGINLLGLTMLKPLLEVGLVDYTDVIAPGLRVDTLFFQTSTGVMPVDIPECTKGNKCVFADSQEGNEFEQTICFQLPANIFDTSDQSGDIEIKGSLNRDTGIIKLYADVDPEFLESTGTQLIGYTVCGSRRSSNPCKRHFVVDLDVQHLYPTPSFYSR